MLKQGWMLLNKKNVKYSGGELYLNRHWFCIHTVDIENVFDQLQEYTSQKDTVFSDVSD